VGGLTVMWVDCYCCIRSCNIIIVSCSEIWIPNAFTPDGDNLNDVFKPECLNISEFHMVIYDRWGTLVFESNQCNEGWDGKFKGEIAPFGIYSYVIEFREIKEYRNPEFTTQKRIFDAFEVVIRSASKFWSAIYSDLFLLSDP